MFVAYDWMRLVGRLHRCDFLGRELDVYRFEDLFKVVYLGCANNRRDDARGLENPSAGELGRRHSTCLRNLLNGDSDFVVVIVEIEITRDLVRLRAFGR